MPAGSTIYIFDPSVQPEIFYLHGKLLFTGSVKELPINVPWLLAPATSLKLLRGRFQQCQVLAQPRDQGGRLYALVSLEGRKIHASKAQGPIPIAPAAESPRK